MTKDMTQVQTKAVDLRNFLNGDRIKDQLGAALPKWLSVDRLLRIVFTSAMKNPKLLDCTRESILSSVMQCAQLGLEPILGRAYLIPYDNRKNINGSWVKVSECQMQVGYQGLVDLARRTDSIADVWGANVYENDEFQLQFGMDRNLYHRPWYMDPVKRKEGEPGEIIGAYVVWKLKDGTKHPEFMPLVDIHKRRAISQAFQYAEFGDPKKGGGKKNSVWHQWPEEMNLKTVIKHSAKLVPSSIEFMEAIELDDATSSGRQQMAFFGNPVMLPGVDERGEGEDAGADFERAVADFADSVKMKRFVLASADANGVSEEDIKASAMENLKDFRSAYNVWMKANFGDGGAGGEKPQKKDGGRDGGEQPDNDASDFINEWLRLHGPNYKKYVEDNFERFYRYPDWVLKKAQEKYQDKVGEPWPEKTSGAGGLDDDAKRTRSGEGGDKDENEIVDPEGNREADITQSDEWNELSMLQSQYPDIYKKQVGILKLKTVDDLAHAIGVMEQHIELETKNVTGDDDIPY